MVESPSRFAQFALLVYKDLALQWRNKDALFVALLFSLLVVLVFAFAYGPFFAPVELSIEAQRRELAKLAASVYWVAAAFAGVIAFHRSAEIDREGGALKAIRLAATDSTTVYAAKVVSMTGALGVVQIVLAPLIVLFFQIDAMRGSDVLRLAGIAAAASVGLSSLGAFLATMTASARGRESMLSVALLPLLIPLLIAATKCSTPVFASEPIRDGSWLGLLIAYPLIMLAIGLALFDAILED